MGNTFGNIFKLTSFGESHGPAMGGVVDGMPAGIKIDCDKVQRIVDLRRPGQSQVVTQRDEPDRVELLSGIFEGMSLGTPIGFVVRNRDARSSDYDHMRDIYRPSHADYAWQAKYGIRDHRGGGRASARETVSRVVAGALAMQVLEQMGIQVLAYTTQIGNVVLQPGSSLDWNKTWNNAVRCPDETIARCMQQALDEARALGDTLGGKVCCAIFGVKPGLGEPVFNKLNAALAQAMMSIPAAKSFDMGAGRALTSMRGSETLDTMHALDGGLVYEHNFSGGIQGGISNGNNIFMEVGFKPVPTLMRNIDTIDTRGNTVTFNPGGRHDVCVVPRAVSVVQAMAAMVLLDHYLLAKTNHL
ncbi:MAG: chorismate synthase [Muribaculaceae bacterium]|nr:chorismate synthase [Muribaculaceae bacterium]